MRTTLALIAVSALPLAAIAQPAGDADTSATVSELVVEARKATTVSEFVVEGCAMPADSEGYSTRAHRPTANAQFEAPARPGKRTQESPGTREFILRNIIGFRKGTADYEHMDEALARITRANMPLEKRWIVCRGAFKNIRFLHVSRNGFDDFEVDFSGAAIEWEVKPFDLRQVTSHWAARFYYPEPLTKQFDEVLASVERGFPSYDRLSPDAASAFGAQWPTLKRAAKAWRGPHSIVFLRQDDDGAYDYKVVYRDHVVFWTVGPLDGAGKITALAYEEGA